LDKNRDEDDATKRHDDELLLLEILQAPESTLTQHNGSLEDTGEEEEEEETETEKISTFRDFRHGGEGSKDAMVIINLRRRKLIPSNRRPQWRERCCEREREKSRTREREGR
jgi:hypothetical protein